MPTANTSDPWQNPVPGMLIMIALVVYAILTGLRVYRRAENREVKMLSLSVVLALITYFFHGTMNNFLDTDKASVPVWGFIAILVALDLYHSRKVNGGHPEK